MLKSIRLLSSVLKSSSPTSKSSYLFNNKSTFASVISRTMSTTTAVNPNLFVSPQWLNDNLSSVKVVDASWWMPHEKRDIRADYQAAHIDGAVLFDIDEICDKSVNLPHNLPTPAVFEKAVGERLGISEQDHVVIYDCRGTYVASARVWWTFLIFGHNPAKVSILRGGLPAWTRANLPTVAGAIKDTDKPTTYKSTFNGSLVKNREDLEKNIVDKHYQVVDARVADRFYGRVDEPRPGLHRGHIPGAFNVPWVEIVNSAEGGYQNKERVLELFKNNGINVEQPILTTCGSGTTAAVLTLGLHSFGYPIAPIYDGSWSEWGQPQLNLPVEPIPQPKN
ncbi:hypothetical protein PPL_01672 [Heterostelium album PN500]|uniref:Sulfurtransferase n=1 Tax=Heterostelium pallidum (strain ATCC 26659 / Pp 5 / PN500) TaxID=670386 RepID=D3B056_HETP5|nr:hypothetical protein PPL_01672 [Heterostelium album PN500]EFA84680.1 hypothetical protein PPL_01672 [Heterostelium album PN500]|eukprot:XP_020436793.1 hypothetical protein PPL_01672 [Heterostelium album PN500]